MFRKGKKSARHSSHPPGEGEDVGVDLERSRNGGAEGPLVATGVVPEKKSTSSKI